MAGTVEGVKDEGAGGLWQGQGEKRSRIFLRWEASGFDCLERTQAGVSLLSQPLLELSGAAERGQDGMCGGLCQRGAQPLHLPIRASGLFS